MLAWLLLASFVGGCAAWPLSLFFGRRAAGWLLALLPAGLFATFVRLATVMESGQAIEERVERGADEALFGAGTAPDMTALSEQQLAVALLRALEAESPGAAVRHDSLLYYRSRTNAEIDFVSPSFRQVCVESKFVDRGWGRAFQTIEASGRAGVVATRSGTQEHDGGWALPAGLVAFLLGQ